MVNGLRHEVTSQGDAVRTDPQQPHGSRIDPYVDVYAARARGMIASEIRALFAVAARPEIVSFAGGSPDVSALPLDVIGGMAGQLIADHGSVALQYCPAHGDPGLREKICEVMALEGVHAHPDDVVVTVGSQQALDLITRIFADPVTYCSPRHPRMSARSVPSPPTRRRCCTCRWTTTGSSRRHLTVP